jgi:hypothetical protein
MLNPMTWLSTLETTLTSPQASAVMAEDRGSSRKGAQQSSSSKEALTAGS